ncbi:MAG: DUF6383 domain-containing protein [Parabacteroides sp.]|nr:DUF6383 domain-containing protein [Parabacteroides sp.]
MTWVQTGTGGVAVTSGSWSFNGTTPTTLDAMAAGSTLVNGITIKESGQTNYLDLSSTADGNSTSEAVAYFYMVTEPVLTATTESTPITFGADKYLVYDKTKNTASLVDCGTFKELLILGYTSDQYLWDIDANGVISLASNPAVKVAGITNTGSYAITLGTTGAKVEKNGDNLYIDGTKVGTDVLASAAIEAGDDALTSAITADALYKDASVAFAAGETFMIHRSSNNTVDKYISKTAGTALTDAAAGNAAYWTAEAVNSDGDVYRFVNADGEILDLANIQKFIVKEVPAADGNGLLYYLLDETGKKVITYTGGTYSATAFASATNIVAFSFHKAASTAYTAGTLVKKLGDGFTMTLSNKKDGVTDLQGNPFLGKLEVVKATTDASGKVTGFESYKTTDNTTTSYMLANADGIIVLNLNQDEKWSVEGITIFNGDNGGFKFQTISKDDMKTIINSKFGDAAYAVKKSIAYNFSINHSAADQNAISSIEVKGETPAPTAAYRVISYNNNEGYFLSAGKHVTSPTESQVGVLVYAVFGSDAFVLTTDDDNNPLNYKYVNIAFISKNAKVDGKVLAMDENGNVNPVQASKFLFGKPEGQWAVTATNGVKGTATKKADAYVFTFTNRESHEVVNVANMYSLGSNKYAVSYTGRNPFGFSTISRDTLVIVPADASELDNNTVQMDGYANFKALDVQDNQYRLAVASTEETNFYVTENHSGKHLLGLTKEIESAATWKLVPLTAKATYGSFGVLKTPTDSIYQTVNVGYYDAKGKYQMYTDTLAIISYALQNASNGEYLTYENPQTLDILSMICDKDSKDFTTSDLNKAYRFVLKEKQNGKYNLVGVDQLTNKSFALNLNRKLYGATTTKQGAVEVEGAYEQVNSNDLFDLQLVSAPEYRLQSMGDTIRIFRQENEFDQMFEKGEFLNVGNKAQLTSMAPAMYVDTAYVNRGHNSRYRYLLVVEPKYVPAEPCTIEGHPAVHPDTTYGRFLVNLVDTANLAYQNGAIHTNKYINEGEAGETYAKLGFVYGFRTADKLYITDKNFKKSGKTSDVIDLGTSDFNVAKFAFQYINPIDHESDGSFKIQTGYYKYEDYIATGKQPKVFNDGYLKNINGVVVVAKGYEAGDKFDLAAEQSNPTANEGVNATTFSVATIDGAVVISGAEGKNVTITNVLGQTITSTVIASSEATISVPASIVVVAVEGEAAVKAIVK